MKKRVLIMFITLASLVSGSTFAQTDSKIKIDQDDKQNVKIFIGDNDSIVIVNDGIKHVAPIGDLSKLLRDSVFTEQQQADNKTGIIIKVTEGGKSVTARLGEIDKILDDTIYKSGAVTVENYDDVEVLDDETENKRLEAITESVQNAHSMFSEFLFTLVVIILLSLLFYYLHRRRKYKMVETAIQNNYPLPGDLIGSVMGNKYRNYDYTAPMQNNYAAPDQQQYQPQYNAPATEQYYNAPQSNPEAKQSFFEEIRDMDPKEMSSGYSLVAVGLGLMLFFLFIGTYSMVGMMSILLFLGLGKIAVAYQRQRRARNYQQPRPPYPPTPPQEPTPNNYGNVYQQPESQPEIPNERPQEFPPAFNPEGKE